MARRRMNVANGFTGVKYRLLALPANYCFLNYDSPPGIDEPVNTICNYFSQA